MRRSDRLFQIIQILRSASRKPITAIQLAQELEISVRTIYRDMADLMAQRIPIRGEKGIGYILESGYDMPPLMLTEEELEAALLGAQWVAAKGDPALVNGARDLISKIGAVIPDEMQSIILEPISMTPKFTKLHVDNINMQYLRNAIRHKNKIYISYKDNNDNPSKRKIWPIAIAYCETTRLIIAWCEMRKDFRHFRTDRINSWQVLSDKFKKPINVLRNEWWENEKNKSTS